MSAWPCRPGLSQRPRATRAVLRSIGASLALAVLLAGHAVPAVAQGATPSAAAPPAGLDDVLQRLNLKARVTPAPDFVVRSRPNPDRLNYVPVGAQHRQRTDKVMTPAELAAAEAGLDAARTAQQRRTGIKSPPVPDKPRKTTGKAVQLQPKTLP